MTLGQRIKQLRKDFSLTQDQLAEILKVTRNTIGKYERDINQPDIDMLISISNYFNVSLDYLFGRTDNISTLEQYFNISVSDTKTHKAITSIKNNLHSILLLKNSDSLAFFEHKDKIVYLLECIFKNKK